MANIDRERWDHSLKRVRLIEQHAKTLQRRFWPKKFTFGKRSAWSTQDGMNILPLDQRDEISADGQTMARVRAESVLIGKFDVEAEVRLRAFYPHKGLSIRYQAGGQRNGITRTVTAYQRVHPFAPRLMPTVYEHGTILNGQGAYLIEETVEGEPITTSELEKLILPITSQLHLVHQGNGIQHQHLSKIVGGYFRKRWDDFVTTQNVPAAMDKAVQQLIDRNDLLEVSLIHGDLVNSNILTRNDDFVLVDWEFSELKPIAFDMAKMIINVKDIEPVLQDMHKGFGGSIGTRPDHYTFREQIALALVLNLSWHKNHVAKAKIAKRTEALKRQTDKRVATLNKLLAV